MKITLSQAVFAGNAKNCVYPRIVVAADAETLKAAVKNDHVCGIFKDHHRSIDNFESCDAVVMDCDNTHTDDSGGWITPEMVLNVLPDVCLAIVPSRHNLVEKDGKAARPKFHVYFPIKAVGSADECAAVKKRIYERFTFFDKGALDAARFIYGNEVGEVIWQEGSINIDAFLASDDVFDNEDAIQQGSRNSTMSHFAAKVLVRFGICDKAHELYLEKAKCCNPPLDDAELELIWQSAVKFAKKVQAQADYVPPESYNGESLKPEDYSDIGEAKVLAQQCGGVLRYTPATDFLCYNGVFWEESKTKALGVQENFLDEQLIAAIDEVATTRTAASNAGVTEDQLTKANKSVLEDLNLVQAELYKAYLGAMAFKAFVMKRRDVKYMQSALVAVKPMVYVEHNLLDKNELLLNTPNGTYFLAKGLEGVQEHRAEDMLTKVTTCSPGEAGKAIWRAALDVFFCGDKELISYVQIMVGSAMVGKVYAERMIIAHGDGANGKSTFWNAIARVIGSYAGNLSSDALTMGCKRNVKPEMAEIRGKRLIIASELQEGTRLNTSVVKQLCSTDDVYAEKKYKDPFSFRPSHTLVLYTNHLPKVGAMDNGIWRRLIIIPFNAKIEGKSDIKDYAEYLVANAGEAIMAWLIEGAKMAIDCGFHITPPEVVLNAIKVYKEANNWMGHFLEECCYVGDSYQEKSGELYQKYRCYCTSNGEYTRSTTDFYGELERLGFVRNKTKKGIIIKGLMLKIEDFLE